MLAALEGGLGDSWLSPFVGSVGLMVLFIAAGPRASRQRTQGAGHSHTGVRSIGRGGTAAGLGR